jgi:hypothetical protein
VLGKFDEAIACCNRHLEISRELEDKVGEIVTRKKPIAQNESHWCIEVNLLSVVEVC